MQTPIYFTCKLVTVSGHFTHLRWSMTLCNNLEARLCYRYIKI